MSLGALGPAGTHEHTLAHGRTEPDAERGQPELTMEGQSRVRKLKGVIPMDATTGAVPSFACPNVQVEYVVVARVVDRPGEGQGAEIVMPVRVGLGLLVGNR